MPSLAGLISEDGMLEVTCADSDVVDGVDGEVREWCNRLRFV